MGVPALTSDTRAGSRCRVVTYSQSAANDGNVDLELPRPMVDLVIHLTGTYVSGTVTVQVSNNGVTYVACPTATSLSALGVKNIVDKGYRYYRFAFASMHATNDLILTVIAKLY
jgi:hypothetical protein